MTKYALIFSLVVALLSVLGSSYLIWRHGNVVAINEGLIRDGAAMQLSLEQAQTARDVAAAYAKGSATRTAKLQKKIEELITTEYGGCADETIDGRLLDLVDGL